MSEERLQEIKDSLNAQYKIAKSDNKYQSVYFVLDEEKELIEEIERLHSIIKEVREYIKDACYLDEINYPNSLGHKQTMKVLEILDKGE